MPYLSLVIVYDNEKDPELLGLSLRALELLNAESFPDDVEIWIMNQCRRSGPRTDALMGLVDGSRLPISVCHADHEFVDDLCLWDVMDSLKRLWPTLAGRYVLIAHPEFIFSHDYFGRLIYWLREKQHEPAIALANLRRMGTPNDRKRDRQADPGRGPNLYSSCPRRSADLKVAILNGHLATILARPQRMETTIWGLRHGKPVEWVGEGWEEDVFVVRKDWWNALDWFAHADRLLFQDVYDLVGASMETLCAHGLDPYIPWLPRSCGEVYHLYHPKLYAHLDPAVWERFDTDPKWEGTNFRDPTIRRACLRYLEGKQVGVWPFSQLRRNRGGTVDRFARAFREWCEQPENRARVETWLEANGETIDTPDAIGGPTMAVGITHPRAVRLLSAAVLTHPRRRAMRLDLLNRLAGDADPDDPVPFVIEDVKGEGCWPTARRAWEGYDREAAYHLVLQDDALPCRRFLAGARKAIEALMPVMPAVVSFYGGFGSEAVMQAAESAGSHWVVFDGLDTGVAPAIRTDLIPAWLAWNDKCVLSRCKSEDIRIGMWVRYAKHLAYFTVPSLVDHRGDQSLIWDQRMIRRATRFIGEKTAGDSVDWTQGVKTPPFFELGHDARYSEYLRVL